MQTTSLLSAAGALSPCITPRRGVASRASILLGGWLLGAIPKEGMELPLLGLLPAWRLCFFAAAAPGVGLALLLLTVRESMRREVSAKAEASSVGELSAFLKQHRHTSARLLTYLALLAMIGYSMLSWAPALFERRFDMPTAGQASS